jgi:hypothetical protein
VPSNCEGMWKAGAVGPREPEGVQVGVFETSVSGARRGPARPGMRGSKPCGTTSVPHPEKTHGSQQHPVSITQAPNGDLLMQLRITDRRYGRGGVAVLVRSTD